MLKYLTTVRVRNELNINWEVKKSQVAKVLASVMSTGLKIKDLQYFFQQIGIYLYLKISPNASSRQKAPDTNWTSLEKLMLT